MRSQHSGRASLRLLLLLFLVGTLPAGTAGAEAPFAALTVTPFGSQVYDITTGVTTLPEGGTITDQDTGVSLDAKRIEYRAQDYVEAWSVSLTGSFGKVAAEALRIDLAAGLLTASGGLHLERDALAVDALNLRFDANTQIAVFGGGVTSTEPAFTADRVLLDVTNGDVLLEGEYVFDGGLFTMRSPEGGGMLALKLVVQDGVAGYDAATEVTPEMLARFSAEL